MNVDMRTANSRDDYTTPKALFDRCNECWGPFEVDLAASPQNTLCPKYYSKENSALDPMNVWVGKCWCNPPYGRLMQHFLQKSITQKSLEVGVFLVPCRIGSKWFRQWYKEAARRKEVAIILLSKRLQFSGMKNTAQFDSMLVVCGEANHVTAGVFSWFKGGCPEAMKLFFKV